MRSLPPSPLNPPTLHYDMELSKHYWDLPLFEPTSPVKVQKRVQNTFERLDPQITT